jgi:hypothetical protein
MSLQNIWWNATKGKNAVMGEKSFPVPLCPPQIPHELPWD